MSLSKTKRRERIKQRIRKKIKGTSDRPRMCVFKSNKHIYVQIIDDTKHHTITATSSRISLFKNFHGTKTQVAAEVGKIIAEKALKAGIIKVVFDRNGYKYHGRVKALADSARSNGLLF